MSFFSCCSENAFTSSSPITTNIAVAIIPNKEQTKFILQSLKRRESLGRHSDYIQKVRHSVPGCSDRIDSTSVFVPGKTLLSIKQTVEQWWRWCRTTMEKLPIWIWVTDHTWIDKVVKESSWYRVQLWAPYFSVFNLTFKILHAERIRKKLYWNFKYQKLPTEAFGLTV